MAIPVASEIAVVADENRRIPTQVKALFEVVATECGIKGIGGVG